MLAKRLLMDVDKIIFSMRTIAQELSLPIQSIKSVIQLFDEGNTIPFIARYRKEATGNLNEVQIKEIQDRYCYFRELEERRQTILTSIESQGKLTKELKEQILSCQIKTILEDLYLPYKPKRRTRAMIAREKGLEPLADLIMQQPLHIEVNSSASEYINLEKGVESIDQALSGACDIIAEKIAENASIRALVRDSFKSEGIVVSKVRREKAKDPTKFEQYYDFKEPVRTIPSHRYLAIRRGEREEILEFEIAIEADSLLFEIGNILKVNPLSSFNSQLKLAIEDSYHRLLKPSVETDIRLELKGSSDRDAVAVFSDNLRHLLLASPLGGRVVIGIDPGIRTGCKCAAVDSTGKFLESATIFPTQTNAKEILYRLVERYNPYAIAIGNGTAGRETESFVRQFLKDIGQEQPFVISVSESGASVYSASDVAREEFPDLDLTIRGAISIARRLQDPLAELVKIDPKSIGVGQYQHDVHQPLLQSELQHVVESCVNHVGVDLNTASASLLAYVSGIGTSLARKIVKYREENGAFRNRKQLRDVGGFGSKTFEQAAGFLRIQNGDYPLDSSAVHPERYELVEQMAQDLKVTLNDLISNSKLIDSIDRQHYIRLAGELTLADIIQEIKKPGRDPRTIFEPPKFRDDIMSMSDLKNGLILDGIVTNVTAFGAFVDIGVHQDGLIHLSELSDRFIKHPNEVVKAGDKIKVEVTGVDIDRKRISLTARIGQKREKLETFTNKKNEKSKFIDKEFKSNPFSTL